MDYQTAKKEIQTNVSWDKNYMKCLKLLARAEKHDGENEFRNCEFIEALVSYKEKINLVKYGEC